MTADTASHLVHRSAGRPAPAGPTAALVVDEPSTCAACGAENGRTADLAKVFGGGNFADRHLLVRPDSGRICEPCLWSTSGAAAVALRTWTVVAVEQGSLPQSHPKAPYDTERLCLTNRANPRPVSSALADPPDGRWVVAVAESSQKHVVLWAPVNHGPGRWTVRMENTPVSSDPDEWTAVLTAAATLRAAGHRADDVADGVPTLSAVRTADDIAWWDAHQAHLARDRRSPLLALALWCVTKETFDDHARPRPPATDPDKEPRRDQPTLF